MVLLLPSMVHGTVPPRSRKDLMLLLFHSRMASQTVHGKYLLMDSRVLKKVMTPGQAKRRPCGLAQGPDGSLYVSDDVKGTIYKIVYKGN